MLVMSMLFKPRCGEHMKPCKLICVLLGVLAIFDCDRFDEEFLFDNWMHGVVVSAEQQKELETIEQARDQLLEPLQKPLSDAENSLRTLNHRSRQILFEYGTLLEKSLSPEQIDSLNQKRSSTFRRRAGEIAEFMRRFAELLDALSSFDDVAVFEALPRATAKELDKIKMDQLAFEFDGWSFYAEPLRTDRSQIENLRSTFAEHWEFRHHYKNALVGKGCGGFHPDFYVRWKTNEQENHVLICLGCSELKFLSRSTKTTFDFEDNAWQSFAQFAISTFRFHGDDIKQANTSRIKK